MFLSDINIGQYIPTGSVIHKLDPRAKLFFFLIIISAIFPAQNFFQVLAWTIILIFIIKLSKISGRIILKAARPLFFLVIFAFIFNLIAAFFAEDFLQALYRTFFVTSRLAVLMLFAVLLPLTTAPLELADGIDALLKPFQKFGLPSNDIAMMIGMALRFIPLLMQETDKIIKAQLSRGARLDQGNLFQRAKAFIPVLIPLFVIIFRRADEIALAMEARGYDSGKGRTRRKPLTWKKNDTLAIILVISFTLVIIFFV